jgi:protoporphyrinogen/coproporphyrinogen III oxidase
VHADGRLHPLPSPSIFGIPVTPSGAAEFSLLPPEARDHLAKAMEARATEAELATAPEDESVASFYRRHFGPATVSLIAEPLLAGIHAGDVEKLSIRAVAPRLVAAAAEGRLFQAPVARPGTGDGLFKALRGGMGELVSAIESRLPAGSVRVRTAAQAVSFAAPAWQVATASGTFAAHAVVLAAPAHAAARVLAAADAPLAALCSEVPYVSTVSVALAWPRASIEHPMAGSGFVVARQHSELRISACTWVSSKWSDRARPGMVLLRAFLGGASDPGAIDLPDAALVDIATRDISPVLRITGAPHLVRVQRWPRAGAQHNIGHGTRLARIEQRLEALPGLFVAGSGFHSIGVPDCVADGRSAATRAAAFVAVR